jgi:iron-sulfur cluster assembly protein
MIVVTPAAIRQLKQLVAEHPDDPIVRLTLHDLDEQRLGLGITLEAAPHPDDEIQDCDGLTVAVEARSAARMDGITLDYREPEGFKFLHPTDAGEDLLRHISLN